MSLLPPIYERCDCFVELTFIKFCGLLSLRRRQLINKSTFDLLNFCLHCFAKLLDSFLRLAFKHIERQLDSGVLLY